MPTINQLVRKPRKSKIEKSDSPALNIGYNSHKKVQTKMAAPTKTWRCYSCWNNDT
ncbi:30S ribosomal protein S12 [Streptococcus pyogenes]|nr:30S ribosomal protein S12 [Streptococcus pyogenes]